MKIGLRDCKYFTPERVRVFSLSHYFAFIVTGVKIQLQSVKGTEPTEPNGMQKDAQNQNRIKYFLLFVCRTFAMRFLSQFWFVHWWMGAGHKTNRWFITISQIHSNIKCALGVGVWIATPSMRCWCWMGYSILSSQNLRATVLRVCAILYCVCFVTQDLVFLATAAGRCVRAVLVQMHQSNMCLTPYVPVSVCVRWNLLLCSQITSCLLMDFGTKSGKMIFERGSAETILLLLLAHGDGMKPLRCTERNRCESHTEKYSRYNALIFTHAETVTVANCSLSVHRIVYLDRTD